MLDAELIFLHLHLFPMPCFPLLFSVNTYTPLKSVPKSQFDTWLAANLDVYRIYSNLENCWCISGDQILHCSILQLKVLAINLHYRFKLKEVNNIGEVLTEMFCI